MYHPVLNSWIIHSAHTVYLSVLYGSQNKRWKFPCTIWAESLKAMQVNLILYKSEHSDMYITSLHRKFHQFLFHTCWPSRYYACNMHNTKVHTVLLRKFISRHATENIHITASSPTSLPPSHKAPLKIRPSIQPHSLLITEEAPLLPQP
jgi:hypothetical protein